MGEGKGELGGECGFADAAFSAENEDFVADRAHAFVDLREGYDAMHRVIVTRVKRSKSEWNDMNVERVISHHCEYDDDAWRMWHTRIHAFRGGRTLLLVWTSRTRCILARLLTGRSRTF